MTLDKVARIELGRQSFGTATREHGKVAAAAAIQLSPGANAVAMSKAVNERMAELSRAFPRGVSWSAPFDTAPFVRISIEKVLHTLVEAMVLVFLVMYLFLQNIRYTLIPAIVAPIALLGTVSVMLVAGYPSISITGSPASGVSSGNAMKSMEELAANLPRGFAVEWTGASLQEREAGFQAPMLLALSLLVVFLVLAALYESWSIPAAVMLVVPLGLTGAVAAVMPRGMANDIFFRVGLITIIGLSAKNAILIVEFAKRYREVGMSLVDAALAAAKVGLRPAADDQRHPNGQTTLRRAFLDRLELTVSARYYSSVVDEQGSFV